MSLKEIKVRIPDLEPGMYVSQLDRPWIETPYLLQGFLIESREDIDELFKYCKYVFVDVELSSQIDNQKLMPRKAELSDIEKKQYLTNTKPLEYEDETELDDELKSSREHHSVLSNVAENIMIDISNNKKLDLPSLKKAITPMVNSVIRNPDAFSWLTRMKHKDNYTYNHAVSTAVWAVAFGRHLGMPKKDLQSLAIGALLFDIGKMRLPDKLINNPNRFNQYEFKLVKTHVEHSIEIVSTINGISDDVIDMVKTHHERHNGSGYPNGLKENEISIFGKIAGIVDCYDAIISERPFASAMSPHDAVKKFYEWRDIDFQAELIEQFIQVVGIYPVGTIVELNDGRVGVIIAQHRVWRLRPKIMLLLDENKDSFNDFDVIDLYLHASNEDGDTLEIVKSLEPGMYGIDPEQFYL
ncbi:MAG: HD-GYP domain-containing protein [Gammaproteobacteria bacterium]|nr:HD-GYP domain-containing protein [Gammaproteobacteria bacterium]